MYILIIILLISSISVYFFVVSPMLKDRSETRTEEQQENREEEPSIQHDDYQKEERSDPITEKAEQVTEALIDSIKNAFDYLFTKETHIVAIGDSLTEGVGDETGNGGYIGVLERTINKQHKIAHFYNLGKRGQRTNQLLKRLNNADIMTEIKNADIVLITIGANDIMQVLKENFVSLKLEQFDKERGLFEKRLQQIFETIQGYNEKAHIYLLGVYNPFGKYFREIEELDLITNDWNESSEKITNQYKNITFIPIYDIFTGQKEHLLADDHFHPNERGYYRMAERVLNYMVSEER